jgi:hypothetical protein
MASISLYSTPEATPPASTTPSSIIPLSLPPEGQFDYLDALLAACQSHTRLAGYAITTVNTEKRKGQIIKILVCKRGE